MVNPMNWLMLRRLMFFGCGTDTELPGAVLTHRHPLRGGRPVSRFAATNNSLGAAAFGASGTDLPDSPGTIGSSPEQTSSSLARKLFVALSNDAANTGRACRHDAFVSASCAQAERAYRTPGGLD